MPVIKAAKMRRQPQSCLEPQPTNFILKEKKFQLPEKKSKMVVFPHFDDKNLDRWMASPKSNPGSGGIRTEADLSEALKKFHITSCQAAASR